MLTRAKKIGLAATCALVLLLGVLAGWWLRGPPKGTKEMLNFFEALAPKPSTDADWKNLVVEKSTAKISDFDMPMVTVKNVRPLLEPEADTSAHHLAVINTRNQVELKSVIWSHKANRALEIDWQKPDIHETNRPTPESQFYLSPESVPATSKRVNGYSMGTPGGTNELLIRTPSGKKRLAWSRPTFIGEVYFFKNYVYAAGLERDNDKKKYTSIAMLNIDKLEGAGFVPLPPQVGTYAPLMVLDPTTDLLLCIDLDIAWVVCMDLRQGIDQSKKPWPPPWPHPALGPWHGNHDIMAGRDSQLAEGATPPPRPADYP